jgi:CheY-like chemotaxis protein
VALYTEHDAEAALHFLVDRASQQPSSVPAHSPPPQEGGLNWPPTARNISPAQPQARRDAPLPERGEPAPARSASTGGQSGLPSVILLDWHLQRQHGDKFLRLLRADSRLASVPVVVFSTSDASSDLRAGYAHGANGYVVKPSTYAELVRFTGDLCGYWVQWNRSAHQSDDGRRSLQVTKS